MSQYSKGLDKSFLAAGNFNTTTGEFAAVYVSAAQTVNVRATVTSMPIGVLQNGGVGGVASGGGAVVRLFGTTKIQVNDSLAAGVQFRVNTLGLALPLDNATVTGGNQFIGGTTLEAATGASITGSMIEVFWTPQAFARSGSVVSI